MRASALLAAFTVSLGGCLAPAAEAPTEVPSAGFEVAVDPEGCDLAGLVLPTPFDRLVAHLPEGFAPRDAQGVLGTPAPVGSGAVLVFHIECADSLLGAAHSLAEVLVFVEAPSVGADLAPSTADFYATALHVAPGPLRDAFVRAGWDLLHGTSTLSPGTLPAPASTQATFEDAEAAALWSLRAATPAPAEFRNLERIWRAVPSGLAFIENEYVVQGRLGPPTCEAAPGSPLAEVAGRAACEPGDVGAFVPGASWSARVVALGDG